MHLNLLKERFGLTYHSVPKEDRGYVLWVDAGGPKIAPVTGEAGASNSKSTGVGRSGARGAAGVDWIWQRNVEGGIVRISLKEASMSALAGALSMQFASVGAPVAVINKTGLSGKYAFALAYENTQSPGPGITAVLRSQLGLRLTEAKIRRDHIVIDHLEWVPTEH